MEEMMERKVWQRVRCGDDPARELRSCMEKQGELLGIYRGLGRRGGLGRQLFEQKSHQIACLRGLLRVMTGQVIAPPRSPGQYHSRPPSSGLSPQSSPGICTTRSCPPPATWRPPCRPYRISPSPTPAGSWRRVEEPSTGCRRL